MLEFIEEGHIYLYNGVILPSASEIMEPVSKLKYDGIPRKILEVAAIRGTAVHKAVEDYENGLEPILDDETKYYFDSYKTFKNKGRMLVLESEQKLCNGTYAGTIDMVGEVDGKPAIIDLKCTAEINEKLLAVQLALYCMLKGKEEYKDNLYVLHLTREKHTFRKIEPRFDIAEALIKLYYFGRDI